MKKLLAFGAALFVAAAAVPAFASDATDDVIASGRRDTAQAPRDTCACPMHARHDARGARSGAPELLRAPAAPRAEFTDRG